MEDVVILDLARTPIGKRNGALSGVHPADLSAVVLRGLADRVGFDPADVDDVIWGCVSQTGEQAVNVGRNGVLAAGWPFSVPATTVDRQCGSSQQAIHFAAAGVAAGHYDLVVAGGVESMSRVPMLCTIDQGPGEPFSPTIEKRLEHSFPNQGESAELLADKWGITRDQADELAVRSHRLAAAAQDSGAFDDEIVPVTVEGPDGPAVIDMDEGIRRTTSSEALAKLKPVFRDDGIVTAGNASQISDGAAAVVMSSARRADQLGLRPIARFRSFAVVGVDPIMMLHGPIPATTKALERAGLGIEDVDGFEVNEAFATVVAAWLADTGADIDKLNVNGGAMALGHPLGASGARVMATLVHRLRRAGGGVGLQAICEGGGMANATAVEVFGDGA